MLARLFKFSAEKVELIKNLKMRATLTLIYCIIVVFFLLMIYLFL